VRPPVDGKAVLVTGASAGLGAELARQLAPRVKTLVITARRRERLVALAAELTGAHPGLVVKVVACDLKDRASLEALVAEAGEIDVLINNAGLGDNTFFENEPWETIETQVTTNVTALVYLTHRLLPGMLARRSGGILNVSSGFGMQFFPGFATYVGTKHFVTGFTESLRLEVADRGVVVSQVCPGPVATEFSDVARATMRNPGIVEISAERCVREALRGFDKGRALIVPGFVIRLVLRLGALTPRWLLRLFYTPMARRLRLLEARSRTT